MSKKVYISIIIIVLCLFSQPAISLYNLRGLLVKSLGSNELLVKFGKAIWDRDDAINVATDRVVENFPVKKVSVSLISEVEYRLFNRSNNVIIGIDGFLSDKVVIEQLLELDKMQANNFKKPVRRLKSIQEYLESRGQKFLVVIIPLKPTIYKAKFPGPVSERLNFGFLKFQNEMQKEGIAYINLYNSLNEASSEEVIYHKTDAHWNNIGSAIAVKEIINYLSLRNFGKNIYDEKYEISSMKFIGGESTSMALLKPLSENYIRWNSKPEYNIEMELTKNGDSLEKFYGTNPTKAILPKTLMFGNSYMNYYRDAGLQNYFQEFDQVLDYTSFKNFSKLVLSEHELVILNLYESQILFHMVEGDNYNYWPLDIVE